MARPKRVNPGGVAYHVMNRRTAGLELFDDAADYEAFERVLAQARQRVNMRVCAYTLMPNHWHLVLWPREDGDLSQFMRWLTMTHTQRWHAHHHSAGTGHLYQSRFKSFPIAQDGHFLRVCRYVERNPLRAGLVERAGAWRWGSLWQRQSQGGGAGLLDGWPVGRHGAPPRNWVQRVNQVETPEELEALRRCVRGGQPCGSAAWVRQTAEQLGLESLLRPRGRPKKKKAARRGNKGF